MGIQVIFPVILIKSERSLAYTPLGKACSVRTVMLALVASINAAGLFIEGEVKLMAMGWTGKAA